MQHERRKFTDKFLRALKPREKIYEVFDSVPGFGARVSPKGRVTFFLLARFGNSKHPTRRRIAVYSPLIDGSLAKARETALRWQAELSRGVDPVAALAAERRENLRKQKHLFKSVCEEFISQYLPKLRTGKVMESILRKNFMPDEVWGLKSITDITQDDVQDEIKKIVSAGHLAQAHNIFSILRKFFNWAAAHSAYGLGGRSPCDKFGVKEIIGKKNRRSRTLSDVELRAFWRATERMGYPYGPMYRLLALTGQRLGEIGKASRGEYDSAQRVLIIPGTRMKAGEPHACPLSRAAVDIIETLPEFSGKYFFSNDGGDHPAASYSFAKEQLDKLMLEELRATAIDEGRDAQAVTFPPFVIHDLRRTCRSRLSRLRIEEEVKERVLAHLPPALTRTYDVYDFFDEKMDALEQWAGRLLEIVNPQPSNVVALRA